MVPGSLALAALGLVKLLLDLSGPCLVPRALQVLVKHGEGHLQARVLELLEVCHCQSKQLRRLLVLLQLTPQGGQVNQDAAHNKHKT